MNNKFGLNTYRIPWFTDDGRLAGFEYVNMCGDHVEFIDSDWKEWAKWSEKYNKGDIEQCTGLKDKSGKWIFKNDILKSNDGRDNLSYVVCWGHCGWCMKPNVESAKSYDLAPTDLYDIVGKIYDYSSPKVVFDNISEIDEE